MIFKWEQSSTTGIYSNWCARQWHTAASQVSLHKPPFRPLLWKGFIPELFLTAKINKWCKSHCKPAQWLVFIPLLSSCCHICCGRVQVFYPEGLTPTCDLSKKMLRAWKSAFRRKKWEDGCLQDTKLMFEISPWHKYSTSFTFHWELHFCINKMMDLWVKNGLTMQFISGSLTWPSSNSTGQNPHNPTQPRALQKGFALS